MEEYKDKASFEEFFKQNYVPLDYKSIQNEMREAAGDGWSLFTDEYKFRGKIDKKDFIVLPDNRDFLLDDGKFNGDANEMIQRVDIPLMRYDFCEGNDNLQITYTIDEYMPEEMYKQIKPYLRDSSLEYVWDGNHFKKEK